MNEITLIAHSPDELPPRWTETVPPPEHYYFCLVRGIASKQIWKSVVCYDFEYSKWLVTGEELIEWYTVKEESTNQQ